jgi:hypothetical protein
MTLSSRYLAVKWSGIWFRFAIRAFVSGVCLRSYRFAHALGTPEAADRYSAN